MDIDLWDLSAIDFMLEVQRRFDEDIAIIDPYITVSFPDNMGFERTFRVTQEPPECLH